MPARRDPTSYSGCIAASLLGLAAVATCALATGCIAPGEEAPVDDPNEGLLRDFLDGKFDSAGHPLNARVTEAETLCAGSPRDGAIRLSGVCQGAIAGSEQH